MVKVKKLEWKSKNNNKEWVSSNKFYTITSLGANKMLIINGLGSKEFATHLHIAKQACQDHYEAFILSQIENEVKDTNSLENDFNFLRKMELILNAYISNKDLTHLESLFQMIQDWKDEVKNKIDLNHVMQDNDIVKPFDPTLIGFDSPEKINKDLIIYTRHDDLGIFQLAKGATRLGEKEYWFLTFKDSSISGFPDNKSEPFLKGVVIDNHDFGVKLISQFLGDK